MRNKQSIPDALAADDQAGESLDVLYFPIQLPHDLPIRMHYPHDHPDWPIQQLHVHACWELGVCFSGDGIFMVGSKLMSFAQGTVSLIGPDEPHLAQSLPGTISRWAWIYFDPFALTVNLDPAMQSLDPTLLRGAAFNNLIHSDEHHLILPLLKELVTEMQCTHTDHDVMVRTLISQVLLYFKRLRPQPEPLNNSPDLPNRHALARLAPAMQFMAKQYADPMCVEALAQMCDVSESHFRRLFHEAHGQSPQRYWLSLRVRMGSSLLRSSDLGVLEISQMVGFHSLSSFNRHFKQILGTTPSQWRQVSKAEKNRFLPQRTQR